MTSMLTPLHATGKRQFSTGNREPVRLRFFYWRLHLIPCRSDWIFLISTGMEMYVQRSVSGCSRSFSCSAWAGSMRACCVGWGCSFLCIFIHSDSGLQRRISASSACCHAKASRSSARQMIRSRMSHSSTYVGAGITWMEITTSLIASLSRLVGWVEGR